MDMNMALKVNDLDNVATIFANSLTAGTEVELCDKKGRIERMTLLSDIPYGHKIALTNLAPGDPVLKYGESIGAITHAVRKGEHVHIHNMDSLRGRGDL